MNPLLRFADAQSASKNAQAENRLFFMPLLKVYSSKFLPYHNNLVYLYRNSF